MLMSKFTAKHCLSNELLRYGTESVFETIQQGVDQQFTAPWWWTKEGTCVWRPEFIYHWQVSLKGHFCYSKDLSYNPLSFFGTVITYDGQRPSAGKLFAMSMVMRGFHSLTKPSPAQFTPAAYSSWLLKSISHSRLAFNLYTCFLGEHKLKGKKCNTGGKNSVHDLQGLWSPKALNRLFYMKKQTMEVTIPLKRDSKWITVWAETWSLCVVK